MAKNKLTDNMTDLNNIEKNEELNNLNTKADDASAMAENGAEKTVIKEAEQAKSFVKSSDESEQTLDDARRVKVVSPGMLVVKRFLRNKLAIFGLATLIALFTFCFIVPLFYPYGESQIFTTYKDMEFDYANAVERTDYTNYYLVNENEVNRIIKAYTNSYANELIQNDKDVKSNITDSNGNSYVFERLADRIFLLSKCGDFVYAEFNSKFKIGTYVKMGNNLTFSLDEGQSLDSELEDLLKNSSDGTMVAYEGNTYVLQKETKIGGSIYCYIATPEFVEKADGVSEQAIQAFTDNLDKEVFIFEGNSYSVTVEDGVYRIKSITPAVVTSVMGINLSDTSFSASSEFKAKALYALATDTSFEYENNTYSVGSNDGVDVLYKNGDEFAFFSSFVVKRYNGEDTINIAVKEQMQEVVEYMAENNLTQYSTTIKSEKYVYNEETEEFELNYDENGNIVYDEETFYVYYNINSKLFVFRNVQSKYVPDINGKPSAEHILGLDGNAMDNFARIMYGGRISLLIGFIVVFVEIILGMIMGGISGYFGGWIDNLIMRIVDIFYCIPTMPILIIIGATFDSINLPNIQRVIWTMAIIGFLGWPGIARLVRGQILYLREQDYMVAAESTGLTSRRKIFKHLIPNVMPQLIVQATMGLGSVIITESTLSFLGLGVKFPTSTWGQIISGFRTITELEAYTYIWIPVGALICLAVIAFNFVGDGLRDAFDPRMKR